MENNQDAFYGIQQRLYFAHPSTVQVGTVYTSMIVTKKEVAKFQLWVTYKTDIKHAISLLVFHVALLKS
jgi:hypothetical protein